MNTNELPRYDSGDNPTGCCPRFDPAGWDSQRLHFEDKLFLRVETRSIFHIPTNMGPVFEKTLADIARQKAQRDDDCIVMSRDLSNWKSEHLFSVSREVPGYEMVRLSGDFVTSVFEGPYRDMGKWQKDLASRVAESGESMKQAFWFYTTCPKCAKAYGKNYVVGLAEVATEPVPA